MVVCFNPLKKENHSVNKSLVKFPQCLKEKFPSVPNDAMICLKCKVEAYKFRNENKICDDEYHKAGVAVLKQIKEKFATSIDKQERIMLLTLAPKYWNRRDLIREFNCTEREARKALDLTAEKGILTLPDSKKGKVLSADIEYLVNKFYETDNVSRLMPGLKDCVSLKQNSGKREQIQKRLLLGNLNELYALFKKENENVKIGLTKFIQFKPSHCVSAGSSGTHNVCVCVHHENVKLMLSAINLEKLTKHTATPLKNYKDCIDASVCQNASENCFLGNCLRCPNFDALKKTLLDFLEATNISEIKYDTWTQTDRCTITLKNVQIYEYLDLLCEKLMKLKTHDFFAKRQSEFVKKLKSDLIDGEFIVTFDFAENYAFVVQNAAQSFHWNNNQATIFTVVIYYTENNELKHKSLAIISDNLCHDTIAVYVYQKIIIDYLKKDFDPKKIYYVSDGAAQHFKNKTSFHLLLLHEKNFGMPAEWHFHATAHGKGACDGKGANLKRGARRSSLQLSSGNHILTPEDLFHWAQNHCKETKVFFSRKTEYDKTFLNLKKHISDANMIPGTLKYHAFIPTKDNRFILKTTSLSENYEIFPKLKRKKTIIDVNMKKKKCK